MIFSKQHLTRSAEFNVSCTETGSKLNRIAQQFMKVYLANSIDKVAGDASGLEAVLQFAQDSIVEETLNPIQVKWVLAVFLIQNEAAQRLGVIAPPSKLYDEFNSDKSPPLMNPVTPDTMTGTNVLAYFREDYDFNDQHFTWHLTYPYFGVVTADGKQKRVIDRQGELFLYMHMQILVRYNLESMSWGLGITHTWDYDEILPYRYTPVPEFRDYFGARPPNEGWFETHNPYILPNQRIGATKKNMFKWRDNLFRGIREGFFETVTSNGEVGDPLELTGENAINWVGVVLESEDRDLQETEPGVYINRDMYGSIHNCGHGKFSEIGYHYYISDSNPLGVMLSNLVAPRDPCFWPWHMHINDYRMAVVMKYRQHLDEFQPQAKIVGLAITPQDPTSETPRRGISTFLKPPQLELNEANAKLDHEPYKWDVTIESTRDPLPDKFNPQTFTVRLFITPTVLIDDHHSWAEMDKFTCTLRKPKVTIRRKDVESSVARKMPKEGEPLSSQNFCGWAQNMMLPVGTPEGAQYTAFAMLTDDQLGKVSILLPYGGW